MTKFKLFYQQFDIDPWGAIENFSKPDYIGAYDSLAEARKDAETFSASDIPEIEFYWVDGRYEGRREVGYWIQVVIWTIEET